MNKTKSFAVGLIAGILTVFVISVILFLIFGHITTK